WLKPGTVHRAVCRAGVGLRSGTVHLAGVRLQPDPVVVEPRDRVEDDLGDVVPELLREVDAEALARVADEDRAAPGEPARSRKPVEVEVGHAAHELLAFDCDAGARAGRVVGAETSAAQ